MSITVASIFAGAANMVMAGNIKRLSALESQLDDDTKTGRSEGVSRMSCFKQWGAYFWFIFWRRLTMLNIYKYIYM